MNKWICKWVLSAEEWLLGRSWAALHEKPQDTGMMAIVGICWHMLAHDIEISWNPEAIAAIVYRCLQSILQYDSFLFVFKVQQFKTPEAKVPLSSGPNSHSPLRFQQQCPAVRQEEKDAAPKAKEAHDAAVQGDTDPRWNSEMWNYGIHWNPMEHLRTSENMYKNSGFEAQLRLKSVTGETGPKSKAENCTNKFRQNINMSTQ